MSLTLSKHAQARASQRRFLKNDIELIRSCGTPVADYSAEVYVLLDSNVKDEISQRKRKIQRLEHLRGCQVVCAGDTVVTVYRASRRAEKKLLRRSA